MTKRQSEGAWVKASGTTMSIAGPNSRAEIRDDEIRSPFGGIAAVAVVFAGLYALVRLRDRLTDDAGVRDDLPDVLREDVGRPPRYKDHRAWWEWR
ncbi:MAG: hypothetical protein ACTSWI_06710 [Alphaproteobacteria bacterium]